MISFSFQAETLHLHNDVNLKKLFVTARYYTYKVLIKVDIGILALPIIDYLGRNCRCKIDMFCPKKVHILEEIGMLHNNLVYFSAIVRNFYFDAIPQQRAPRIFHKYFLAWVYVNPCLFNGSNLSIQQKIKVRILEVKALTLRQYGSNLWAEVDFSANLITN